MRDMVHGKKGHGTPSYIKIGLQRLMNVALPKARRVDGHWTSITGPNPRERDGPNPRERGGGRGIEREGKSARDFHSSTWFNEQIDPVDLTQRHTREFPSLLMSTIKLEDKLSTEITFTEEMVQYQRKREKLVLRAATKLSIIPATKLHKYSISQLTFCSRKEESRRRSCRSDQKALEDLVKGHMDVKDTHVFEQQTSTMRLRSINEIERSLRYSLKTKRRALNLSSKRSPRSLCPGSSNLKHKRKKRWRNMLDGAGGKSYSSTEEALRKTRWSNDNVAGKLHDEFKRLYEQLDSMFASNEKVATGRS
ncbi:hypothetical protein YC2023_061339 [Brassica napus]